MSTKRVQLSTEDILVARQQHPSEGARKLARRLAPDATEKDIVRHASRIGRILRKHKLNRADVAPGPAPCPPDRPTTPPTEEPKPTANADDDYLDVLKADLEEARGDMRMMRSSKVFGPIPPMLKKVRDMEEEVTSIRKAREQTHASDIDVEFVLAELRKLPRGLLEAALATD